MQTVQRCSGAGGTLAKNEGCKHNEGSEEGKFGGVKTQKTGWNSPFFHTYAQFAQGYAQQSTGMSTGGHDIIHKTSRQNPLESGVGKDCQMGAGTV